MKRVSYVNSACFTFQIIWVDNGIEPHFVQVGHKLQRILADPGWPPCASKWRRCTRCFTGWAYSIRTFFSILLKRSCVTLSLSRDWMSGCCIWTKYIAMKWKHAMQSRDFAPDADRVPSRGLERRCVYICCTSQDPGELLYSCRLVHRVVLWLVLDQSDEP